MEMSLTNPKILSTLPARPDEAGGVWAEAHELLGGEGEEAGRGEVAEGAPRHALHPVGHQRGQGAGWRW